MMVLAEKYRVSPHMQQHCDVLGFLTLYSIVVFP